MATTPGPHDMADTGIVITPGGNAVPNRITPAFYAELDTEFDGFAGHLLVSRHEFSEAWGMWDDTEHCMVRVAPPDMRGLLTAISGRRPGAPIGAVST